MIGRVVSRPRRPHQLLRYLFGPGRDHQHTSPHLVAAWCGDPAHFEPPSTGTERRYVHRLAQVLEVPVALARGKVSDGAVWHCVVRAASDDPDMGEDAWQVIAAELMHRTGLSEHGKEDKGVRWVAVHHGDNHIHIVAVLARVDGRPVRLHGDWYRIAEAMAWAEREYGLTPVARAGARGTAERRPTRAEKEKADRLKRPAPARTELRRLVEATAAAARTEGEFFAGLAARGVTVRLRYSTTRPGEVTGYAVGLAADATGTGGEPVWFELAPDLTLPRLRAHWPGDPDRLSGRSMSMPAARPVLAREVFRAARAARSEQEFLDGLARSGLMVRLRPDPDRPGRFAGYSVTLPGLADRSGLATWFAGSGLDGQFGLGQLRARWAAGRPGQPPDRTSSMAPPPRRCTPSRRRPPSRPPPTSRQLGPPEAGLTSPGRRLTCSRRPPRQPAAPRCTRPPKGSGGQPAPPGVAPRLVPPPGPCSAPLPTSSRAARPSTGAQQSAAPSSPRSRSLPRLSPRCVASGCAPSRHAGSARNTPAGSAIRNRGVRTRSAASRPRPPARPPKASPPSPGRPGAPTPPPSRPPRRTSPRPDPGRARQRGPPVTAPRQPGDSTGIARHLIATLTKALAGLVLSRRAPASALAGMRSRSM